MQPTSQPSSLTGTSHVLSTPPYATKQLDDTVRTSNPAAQPTAEFPPPSSLTVSGSSLATRAQVNCKHWSQQLPALASKLNVQRHCNTRRILHRRLYRRRRRRRHRRQTRKEQRSEETCLAERLAKAMNPRVPDCEIRGTNKVQMPGRCITIETLHHTTTRWIKTHRRCKNKMEQAHQQYVNAHHQRQTLNQGEPLQQLTIKTTSLIHTTEPQAHVSLDAAHWMEANELVVFNPVERIQCKLAWNHIKRTIDTECHRTSPQQTTLALPTQ